MSWSMLGKSQSRSQTVFRHMGKICLVKGLFRSRFLHQNVGGPIRLLCESDVLHRNNGDQESWAIKAVCRRLHYTGLKPDHEKAIRSFRNGREVLRTCQPWMDRLNANKIAPGSITENGVTFQDCRFLAIRTSREDNLYNEVSQDGITVCHSSSTLYMMSHITFLQALRHNFCNCREQKWNKPFTRPIFPCVVKSGLGTRPEPGSSLLDNP